MRTPPTASTPFGSVCRVPPDVGGGALHVLIIDDSAAFLDAAGPLLAADEHVASVRTATGRDDAITLLGSDPRINVVLIDVNLGPDDGLDLCGELATRWPATSRFLISSLAEIDLPATPARYGARGFIPKRQLDGPLLVRLAARPPMDDER